MRLRRATREEIVRLRSIADYQFGRPAGELLVPEDALVGVSPATRRIREVYGAEGLLAVLRAHDYFFSLSPAGASRLLRLPPPRLRAVLREPPGSKSVPCRLVEEVDAELRPGDEVIAVDRSGGLVGVGRLRLSPSEILGGCDGEAIRLRKLCRG